MSNKLLAKISIPKKKQSKRNGRGRSKRNRGGKGNLVPAGKNFGNSTTIKELWMPIFPASCVKRLRYSDVVSVSSTAGSVGSYVFSCNGLFDPNITGTGHQPMGFDQMMLSYNHYTVLSAKITVTATNGVSTPVFVTLSVTGSATPVTVISQILEFGGNTTEALEAKTVSGSVRVMQAACNVSKYLGVKYAVDDPVLRGDASTNPTEQCYFMIQGWAPSTSGTITLDVLIDYTAKFGEPRILTQSLQDKMKQLILSETQPPAEEKKVPPSGWFSGN